MRRTARHLIALLGALLTPLPALAQCDPQWVLVATTGPSPRAGHAMAYDAARQLVVLFGGHIGTSEDGETWVWDGIVWTRVALSGPQPGPRHNAGMAYDAVREECVMFGRETGPTDLRTWLWNGVEWRSDGGSPGNDQCFGNTAFAYDPVRQRVVMHGGSGWLPDTREWDGSAWILASTAEPPAGRQDHVAAFLPSRGRVVIFGGYASPGDFVNEMWEWDGSAWSSVPQMSPPQGRAYHAMAYDAARSRLVVVGGGDKDVCGFEDTWEFDGTAWQEMDSGPNFPGVASGSAVYDEAHQQVVLFGGINRGCATLSGETRVWTAKPALTSRPQSVSDCPGATASFSITAVGNNTFLDFQWLKDGVEIVDKPGHIVGANSPTLVIMNAVPSDTGNYNCVLTNQCGFVASDTATLAICTTDFNCDSLVNSTDFFDFLTAFFTGLPIADFNSDTHTNSQDFFDFLTAFFAGCP